MSIWYRDPATDLWKVVNTNQVLPSRVYGKYDATTWRQLEALYYRTEDTGSDSDWKVTYQVPSSFNRISNPKITVGASSTVLTWTPPTSTQIQGIRVLRKYESAPTGPNDPTATRVGGVDLARTATGITDTGLKWTSPLGYYYYAIYTQDLDTSWYEPYNLTYLLNDNIPPAQVTSISATARNRKAYVSWTEPTDTDYDHVTVKYSTTGYPTATTGAVVGSYAKGVKSFIHQGPGSTTSFNGVSVLYRPSTITHYYSFFTVDWRGNTNTNAAHAAVTFLRSPIETGKTQMDSWGDTNSSGWETADRLRQSNWYSSNRYTGYYFYGASAAFRSIGSRAITGGWLYMTRQSSGNGISGQCRMRNYTHNSDTKPSGWPGRRASYGSQLGPAWTSYNPMWMRLPNNMVSDLCRSVGRGICFYSTVNEETYVSTATGSEGTFRIYHNDYA